MSFSFFKFAAFTLTASVLMAGISHAQTAIPEAPDPIKNLVAEGAQMRFLGKEHGLDAWLTVKNGQEQYFYVMPGGKAFLMGVLFDQKGKMVTVDQVRRLQQGGDPILDVLADRDKINANTQDFKLSSPAEQMFNDVSQSNWVALGQPNAPVAYAFVDPQCPHCHEFIKDVRGEIDAGKLQVRIVPVGVLGAQSVAQSAFLIAAPNPEERWMKFIDGDLESLPAKTDLNDQGVQRNMAVMNSWKMDATPIIVYRDKADKVKIIRGKPNDKSIMLKDLPPA